MRHGGRAKILALVGALVGMSLNIVSVPLMPVLTAALPTDGMRLAPRMALNWSIDDVEGGRYMPKMMGDGYIGPNGALEVGPYGSVAIAGLTLPQAEAAIAKQLARHLKHPRVRLRLVEVSPVPRVVPVPAAALPAESGPSLGLVESRPAGGGAVAQPLPTSPLAPAPVVAGLGAPSPAPGPVIHVQWCPVPRDADPPPRLVASNWTPIQRPENVVSADWHAPMPSGPALPQGDVSTAPVAPPFVSTQAEPKNDKPVDLPMQPRPVPGPPAGAAQAIDGGPVPGMVGGPAPCPRPPTECRKQSLPPYVIEPPDILIVESTQSLRDQPVRGQHLVRPDGTIQLGIYGTVYVAGMTLEQAREAIIIQLSQRVNNVNRQNLYVDVLAYNSKFYYVITDGGGYGEQVIRFPITGSETVLDALSQINGIPPVGSKKHIWVARSFPCDGHEKVLPVDWCAISQKGNTTTNYQLMPGDRIYVQAQKIITVDSTIAKVDSPIERHFGVTLLGSATVNSFKTNGGNSGH